MKGKRRTLRWYFGPILQKHYKQERVEIKSCLGMIYPHHKQQHVQMGRSHGRNTEICSPPPARTDAPPCCALLAMPFVIKIGCVGLQRGRHNVVDIIIQVSSESRNFSPSQSKIKSVHRNIHKSQSVPSYGTPLGIRSRTPWPSARYLFG